MPSNVGIKMLRCDRSGPDVLITRRRDIGEPVGLRTIFNGLIVCSYSVPVNHTESGRIATPHPESLPSR